MIRRPPRSTPLYSSAASDVYKRQPEHHRAGRSRGPAATPARPRVRAAFGVGTGARRLRRDTGGLLAVAGGAHPQCADGIAGAAHPADPEDGAVRRSAGGGPLDTHDVTELQGRSGLSRRRRQPAVAPLNRQTDGAGSRQTVPAPAPAESPRPLWVRRRLRLRRGLESSALGGRSLLLERSAFERSAGGRSRPSDEREPRLEAPPERPLPPCPDDERPADERPRSDGPPLWFLPGSPRSSTCSAARPSRVRLALGSRPVAFAGMFISA